MLTIHLLSEEMNKCLDHLSRGSNTLKLYKELGFNMLFADRPPFKLFCFLEGGGRAFLFSQCLSVDLSSTALHSSPILSPLSSNWQRY